MISINNHFYLNQFMSNDETRLAYAINDIEIARNTLTIPHPYTLKDAKWWLQQTQLQKSCNKPQRHWAIRNAEGQVCDSFGRHFSMDSNLTKMR